MANRLEGEHIELKSAEVRKHIGKSIIYLRHCDIDKSGRGYYFPKYGKIENAQGRNIFLENGNVLSFSELAEVVINPDTNHN